MIGFNRRFDPGHKSVRDRVADGTVGDLHVLRITSRDPAPPPPEYVAVSGGIFLDMVIHDFDMAHYVVQSPVVEVFARGAVRVDPRIGEAGDVDTAVTVLTHEDGTLTTIDNSREAVYGFDQRVEAFGNAGMAVSDNPARHAGWHIGREAQDRRAAPVVLPRPLRRVLPAGVGGVPHLSHRGRALAGRRRRRAALHRRRPRRRGLAARGPAGAGAGDRIVLPAAGGIPLGVLRVPASQGAARGGH